LFFLLYKIFAILPIKIGLSKLVNLPELGSYAPVGASTDEFANKIADELSDPTKTEFYKPFWLGWGLCKKNIKN